MSKKKNSENKNNKENNIDEKIKRIRLREITDEMKESYLDYAMSVIIARAIPDARDGLKPVHRRILYAMNDMGLTAGAKYRKSANITGITMAYYHPHGDQAIYDALARMAQDFILRYPLIDGQGNWGSVDGDPPAAQRYTECRLSKIGEEILKDIEKETIDFVDNYDGTRREPSVLPSPVPNLLLNGTLGIAVGMATNIPPHNLGELVDAICCLIDHPRATIEDLFQFIKGPDFPTGGEIYNKKEIIQAYVFGRGPIVTRAKAEIVEEKNRFKIIISELTYQTNKSALLEKIAELVKNKKIQGLKDVRDESDKEGIRIVIELKSDAYPQKALNKLYKYTDLQKVFHLNTIALTDGIQPQTLSLKQLLAQFISHRQEVVSRRLKFDLARAKERVHILEGLAKALRNIDKVIALIKKSKDREVAKNGLKKTFKLTEIQAIAILEMRLQTLAALERKKILNELKEKRELIKEIETILASPKKILKVIKKELLEIKEKYSDKRRTKVFSAKVGEFAEEDLVPEEETIITVTNTGYIKRVNPKSYRAQRRGGKGIVGIKTKQEDFVEHFFVSSTHDDLLFFGNKGKVYQTKAYEIPEAGRTSRGRAIVNILGLSSEGKISAVVPLRKEKQSNNSQPKFLAMVTEKGIIKRTDIEKFRNIRRGGIVAINLDKTDSLRWVKVTHGHDEIMLITKLGQAIRFSEKDLRPMGRSARGVRGIKIKRGGRAEFLDGVVGMEVISSDLKKTKPEILIVSSRGYGKRTPLDNYKVQRRGGIGIKAAKVTEKTGPLVAIRMLTEDKEDLIVTSQKGNVIRTSIKGISRLGRVTQGVKIMRLDDKDKVVSMVCV
jgi:DNA gyrase subunit A